MRSNLYSVPNLLSLLRLILVPILITLAVYGQAELFLLLLAVSLVSDVLDGYMARKLQQTSELGARLDSWGDILTYGAMISALYLIWPAVFSAQAGFLLAAMLSFILPLLLALSRFGSYPSYHTIGAKVTAILMAPAYYLLILWDTELFFRAVILLRVLVAVEEIAITFALKRPKSNVDSVFFLLWGGGSKGSR
jgi:CDP-diacylglycerol--glycerol-3-phosphate 3-phosphatidyltransferase